MSYTIVADVCEGLRDCIPACPADCIHPGDGHNAKGTPFVVIDPNACTNCGICLDICPIEGAVLNAWHPELQTPQSKRVAPPGILNARALELKRDVAGAAAAYQRVYEFGNPEKSAEAAYRFGRLLGKQGDTRAALDWYRKGLAFTGSRYEPWCAHEAAAVLHGAGDLAGAVELYRRAMAPLDSDAAAIAALNLGRALADQGDPGEAAWAFRGAIGCAHHEHSPAAALCLAKMCEQQGDIYSAIGPYEQVFKFARGDLTAEAAFLLGQLRARQGFADAAIGAYRRGLTYPDEPYQPLCAVNIAALLANQGDHAEAVVMYRLGMDSPHPNAAAAGYHFGEYLVGQGDSAAAIAAFERAIGRRHHQFSAKAALALGALLEDQGNPTGAAAEYQHVLDFGDAELADDARGRLDRLATNPDPRSAVRAAIIRWYRTHFAVSDADELSYLEDEIVQTQASFREFALLVPDYLAATGKTMFAVSWLDELHLFELSAEQARRIDDPIEYSIWKLGPGAPVDTRQVRPAARIVRLRLNDGAPICSDDSFTVSVHCDPPARLPRDARLRVSYVFRSQLIDVFKRTIEDNQPVEVLRVNMEPLCEVGCQDGPVVVFVELVVVDSDSPDCRCTAISNTLAVLVDVALSGPGAAALTNT